MGGFEDIEGSYSNFDHVMPYYLEGLLRQGKRAEHCAWRHWGVLWFEDDYFHEEVWRNGAIVDTVRDSSLQGVISRVNEEYGND